MCIIGELLKQIDEAFDRAWYEIVATSVAVEQESITSPVKLSFRTTQRVPVSKGIFFNNHRGSPMVIWRDYLIWVYAIPKELTYGLFLWNLRENTTFYFEVCHYSFPSLDGFDHSPTDNIFTGL